MDDEDEADYTVLINDEDQYSLWLSRLPIPGGWRAVGVSGSRQDCSAYVDAVWTDLTPKSLRGQPA